MITSNGNGMNRIEIPYQQFNIEWTLHSSQRVFKMLNILKQVQDFKNPSIKYKIDIFSVSDHIGIL